MLTKINSETHFTRRVSNTDTSRIKIIVYIDYIMYKYTICTPNEESVKLSHYSVDRLNAYVNLLRQAHTFIKKELTKNK